MCGSWMKFALKFALIRLLELDDSSKRSEVSDTIKTIRRTAEFGVNNRRYNLFFLP